MRKIELGDLCEPSAGQLKLDKDTLVDYFDISSVDNVSKTTTGFTTYYFGEAPSRARKPVKRNSILVSTVRPNLNAVALFDEETDNIPVASTGFCVLDCKTGVNPRFVFNFCRSKAFIVDMTSQATGASYPAVSDKIVRSAKIPDYSEKEQNEISDILDRTAEVIELRKAELQKLDELVKARFVEVFGDIKNNDKNWKRVQLKEISDVRGRVGWKGYKKEDLRESGPLVLGATHLTDSGNLDLSSPVYLSREKFEESPEIVLQKDDLIFTQRGNTIGKVGLVENDIGEATINPCVLILRPISINPMYFKQYFVMDATKEDMWALNSGSAQPMITQKGIGEYQVMMPPMELQEKFATFVKQVDKSKAVVQKALDKAQLLFDSLMQKYFG